MWGWHMHHSAGTCWQRRSSGPSESTGAHVAAAWGQSLGEERPGVRMTLLPAPWAELKLGAMQCEEPQDELMELQARCAVTP